MAIEYGSDLVVDLLVRHGIEVVAFNPGASFRGIHDSLVDRGDPKLVLCLHEEIAVAVAHGYAKAAGRPMAVLLHDVVGLQHATMAVYNAWVDRVPLLLIGGTGPRATPDRRPWIDWIHTAALQANQVRDYVKWDDEPADLASVPASLARAIFLATSEPTGPVYVNLDVSIQEQAIDDGLAVAATGPGWLGGEPASPPAPSPADVDYVATHLREADLPVIVTDYAGATPRGFELLRRVAERTGAAVIDAGDRLNFPTRHPLNASDVPELLSDADFVLGLECEDLWGRLGEGVYVDVEAGQVAVRDGVQVVEASSGHLRTRSWSGDHQRLVPVDLRVTTAATPLLASLSAALAETPPPSVVVEQRHARLGTRVEERRLEHDATLDALRVAEGPDIHPALVVDALGPFLADRSWVLTNGSAEGWERRLWDFERPGQHLGWHGGGGLGYGAGASIGAAIALGEDTLCIDLQPDGDLLFTPQALWTAARQHLRLLVVVLNNRQYANTVGHARRMAEHRGRDVELRHVGSAITDPDIDFAALARSQGIVGIGPVVSPAGLHTAITEGIAAVDRGGPALLDVHTTRV